MRHAHREGLKGNGRVWWETWLILHWLVEWIVPWYTLTVTRQLDFKSTVALTAALSLKFNHSLWLVSRAITIVSFKLVYIHECAFQRCLFNPEAEVHSKFWFDFPVHMHNNSVHLLAIEVKWSSWWPLWDKCPSLYCEMSRPRRKCTMPGLCGTSCFSWADIERPTFLNRNHSQALLWMAAVWV